MILSTAETISKTEKKGDVIIVTGKETSMLNLKDLESSFQKLSARPPIRCSIEEVELYEIDRATCVFLDDPESPILTSMSDTRLKQMKRLLQAQGLMWITAATTLAPKSPNTAMITGLARSLRVEITATKIVVVHYSKDGSDLIANMSRVFCKVFLDDTPGEELDIEYMERGGILHVPRLYDDDKIEDVLVKHGRRPAPEVQPFLQPGRALTLKHDGSGMVSGLFFEDQMSPTSSLEPEKIRIEVKAMGVNFTDVMTTLGQVESQLGHECSGIVSEIGSSVTNISVGDRVCALARETFSTTIECNAQNAIKMPDDMSFPDGASIPAVFCTAYYSLVTIAQLQRGESVLIHAAAGGVGQAAIMIAQMIGAEIYATVGHETKKEHLISVYGIDRDRIFSSRTPHFGQRILKATNQRGVDIILNSLGGELLRVSWETLAKFGRFVEIGKRDINRNARLDMATFSKSTTFASVDLEIVRDERPAQTQRLLTEVMDLFRNGKVRTVTPVTIFSIEALGSALQELQGGKIIGKIVIEPLPGQKVKVNLPERLRRKEMTRY